MFFDRNRSSGAEWLVVGLGNPGDKYENTRHNVGFLTVDELAERARVPVQRLKHRALTNTVELGGARVLLMKPVTYMNLSGEAVGEAARFYNQHLGTDQFPRVKIGVGEKPHPDYDMADWVLSKFTGEDLKTIQAAVKKAADAVACYLENGPDKAMNRFNG